MYRLLIFDNLIKFQKSYILLLIYKRVTYVLIMCYNESLAPVKINPAQFMDLASTKKKNECAETNYPD